MMLLLLLLLFLCIPKEIFGIYCAYSEESYEWSLNDFNYENFKMQIDGFPSFDYKDDNIEMCRVEIYIDYKASLLVISFADSFEWSQIDDGEGRLDFLIIFPENNTEIEYYNVLEYACYHQDECNKLFVLNHIYWLQQVNYTNLLIHLTSLLFNNSDQTDNCFIDKNNLIKCSSGVCSGKYSNDHKNYLFKCHQNSETLVEVHITTNMIIDGINLQNEIQVETKQIIQYTCKFNQCNNQFLTDSLINITQNYFPLTSMRNGLIASYQDIDFTHFNLTDQSTFKTPSQQFSSSKTVINKGVQFNIANNLFYISINLIFILFDN